MHTNKLDKKYSFIFWGLIFLFLGLTSSPTLVSGYHILIFIPTLFIFKDGLSYKLKPSSWALLVLSLWALVATLYNEASLIKPFKAYQELKYYLFGVFCIGTLTYFLNKSPKRHIKLLLNLLLFAVVVGFFVGIARSKFGFDPVKWRYVPGRYHERVGGFSNYMRYGYSSALMLVLACGAWFNFDKVKGIVSKNWLIVFTFFSVLAITFSETRGAILASVSGISFLLIKYRPLIGKVLVGLGVTAVISIGVYSFSTKSTNRYLNINDASNNVRLSQFYSAFKSIQEKPIFGLGADQFSYNVIDIKKRYGIWADDYEGHAHNIFLEHGANYGIPGLIAFISFLILWFLEMIRRKDNLGWIIASYIVAFVIGGQVELLFDVINSHLIFFLYSFSQINIESLQSSLVSNT